jgi:pimeloyl-ACP methyl ester carboxylesterase
MHSVILLPGLACDEALFAGQREALAQSHRVLVSDVHTRCATLPQMASTLLAEQPGGHVFVGVSMGGMLALELLRQAPARVQAVALLGTSARPDTPELIELRSQACEMFADGLLDEVLRANARFAFHPHNAANTALVASYLAMIHRAGAAQLIAQNRAVMSRIDSRPFLRDIRCPTLVACGQADGLTPPEHAQEICDAIPHARGVCVADAGHMLTMEQPSVISSLLRDWLDSFPAA